LSGTISVGFGCEEDFEIGAILKELSDIIGRTEDFFSKAGVGVGVRAVAVAATGVFETVEIAGILEIIGAVIRIVEIEAVSDVESFHTKHSKAVL